MIDIKFLLSNPTEVQERLGNRNPKLKDEAAKVANLYQEYKQELQKVEELRAKRNNLSKQIGLVRAQKGAEAAQEIMAQANALKDQMQQADIKMTDLKAQIDKLMLMIPNLPDVSVPVGADEKANVIVKENTIPLPSFDFEPKDHHALGEALGILDFQTASVLSGSRFALLRGDGARLERALINFMIDLHTQAGYMEYMPPAIINASALLGTGQLPKFKEDMYHLEGEEDQYLISTAEIPLTNLYREQILQEKDLPKAFTAYTPCFRKEAGAYGKDTRGLIRNHQFNKVEMVWLSKPQESMEILEKMTLEAEKVLKTLGLPYQRVLLSSGDMGFSAAKTYDLEVWFPSQNCFREISSCSNCTDFQARRMNLRYKEANGKGTQFVHTLNGSGIAVGRTFAAILENYQQKDGSIIIPEALRPYFGKDKIEKNA